MVRVDLRDIAERWVAALRAGRLRAMLLPWCAIPGLAIRRPEEWGGRETTREGWGCYRRGSYKSGSRVCIGWCVCTLGSVAVSISIRAVQRAGKNLSGERFFYARDLLWGALRDDAAAFVAAFGAEVDDPVGLFDDVEMVLDDQHGVAERDEAVQHVEEFLHVIEMEAGGRLGENIQRAAGL